MSGKHEEGFITFQPQTVINKVRGLFPSQSMIMNYMDRTTEKVKVILDRIEKEKTYDSYFTLVTLEYNWDEFIKHNKSISKWFQKLSNSKAKTGGVMNREWFKRVDNGFYKYEIDGQVLRLWLALESDALLNRTDLITRIRKIRPLPISCEVGIQDWAMLSENFGDLFNNRTGLEVFGNIKRNDYFELVYKLG